MVSTVCAQLRIVVSIDCCGGVEVIVVDEGYLRVSEVANKTLERALFNPRRALEAGWSGDVDDVILVARLFHDRAAF